jgi:hypothetical protein
LSHDPRYIEKLRDLAAEAYELSERMCGTCRDQHALWPYIRLAKASTGVEGPGSKLEAQLNDLFSRGLHDVLIAGAQDSGVLALVARAGSEYALNIVVLDICDTPLELCRRFARKWSLPLETVRQDLLQLDFERRFDIVLMHGTLHFIAADRRAESLARMQRAIRPRGRLLLMFNTSRPVAAESRTDYADSILDELKRLNVPLPDTEAAMRDLLNARECRRELRDRAFTKPRDLELLLISAGFDIISCERIDVQLASPMDSLLARSLKQRFMAIAEPKI